LANHVCPAAGAREFRDREEGVDGAEEDRVPRVLTKGEHGRILSNQARDVEGEEGVLGLWPRLEQGLWNVLLGIPWRGRLQDVSRSRESGGDREERDIATGEKRRADISIAYATKALFRNHSNGCQAHEVAVTIHG
jgi:hypothetical protein